ncbi:hypothetical protein [Parasphingorhabdus sp.]|uniref:hypothetical protein n=1 Tax=Parasphingorhabdus sp. TaxID=2709688 RepID=UPI0030031328
MADASEELIVVPMSFLVKAGLFENKNSIVTLTFNHLGVSISYNEDDDQLLVTANGKRHKKWSVGISHHILELGARPYFDIHNNQQSQLFITIYGEHLHSRKSLLEDCSGPSLALRKKLLQLARQRAKYFVPPGAGAAKTRRLAAQAHQSLTPEDFDKLPSETIAAFEHARSLGQLRRDGKNAQNKLSSKYAFANAPELAPFYAEYLRPTSPAQLRRQYPVSVAAMDLVPQPIDNYCRLDIADINHAGMLKRGGLFVHILAWPLARALGRTITLYSDLRDEKYPMLLFELLFANIDEALWQRVMLTQVDSARWYFLCPIDGHPCDTLYFRAHRFGSWQAQKLYHPSQRSGGSRHHGRQPQRSRP